MIARLADFLRVTLEGKASHEVPLSEELFLIEQYLEIEKLRLGDSLQVNLTSDPSISDCLVPHLVLQPLVENAIKHGIAPRCGIGRLMIEASRLNDQLVIKVNDDGLGKISRKEGAIGNGQRVGLSNIERRLKELYGDRGRFSLSWPAEGGCHVLLEMPCRPQQQINHEIQSSDR